MKRQHKCAKCGLINQTNRRWFFLYDLEMELCDGCKKLWFEFLEQKHIEAIDEFLERE